MIAHTLSPTPIKTLILPRGDIVQFKQVLHPQEKKELLANFGKTSRSSLYRAGRISNIMIPVASQIWAKNFT
jgi:hypothetical protein